MSEGFREKTPEELHDQVAQVSESLGQEITQPTKNGEVFKMSLEEIKEKFPVRYEIYLKILRANRIGAEVPEDEKEEMQEWLGVLNNLDKYIEDHHTNGEQTLRERQITVFEDMRDFLEEGGKEGYIKLPTGAGKTVVFSEFIEAIGLKTLIVVPTKILVGQTENKLEEFAEDLYVGKIYNGKKIHGDDVTIITYQSLVKKLEDGSLNPDDYKCLILDEAHTALSDKRSEAVRQFDKAIKIGFTATPKYSEDKNVGQLLNTEIHSLEVKEAAEEGVISPFSVILAETNIDMSSVKVTHGGEYDEVDLQKAVNVAGRNNSAVELYKRMFNGELAVAYCSGIEHAKEVARLFNQKGIAAEVVSGRQGDKEQGKVLERFKGGETKVLCNADILIAGFDEPKASVCLNLRPTLSPVVAEQRGGRVLRLNSEDPKKHATIVDFVDKNEDERIQPITFAEVADASVVYPKSSYGGGEHGGDERIGGHTPGVEIEGLKVVTDSEEVMKVMRKMVEGKAELAPEGWYTMRGLAKELGRDTGIVRKHSESYRTDNPHWFHKYIDTFGRYYEHISPELAKKVKEALVGEERAPDGWVTFNGISKHLGVAPQTVRKYAEKFRADHPDWFKQYMPATGPLTEHYSPELITNVAEMLAKNEMAPEGWLHVNKLAKKLGKSNKMMQRYAEKFRTEHPDWFKDYLTERKILTLHYAPELIEKIAKELEEGEPAPENWMILHRLAKKLGKSESTVNNYVESFRSLNPDWFKMYWSERSVLREYFSPELVALVESHFNQQEKAPTGWLHQAGLSKETGKDTKVIRRLLENYRDSRPDWFKYYLNLAGQHIEHYSPELVEKVKEDLRRK